jgi:hypothetical protein
MRPEALPDPVMDIRSSHYDPSCFLETSDARATFCVQYAKIGAVQNEFVEWCSLDSEDGIEELSQPYPRL